MKNAWVLKNCPIFSGLDDRPLDELARLAGSVKFEEGGVVFNEGEDARALYILVNGAVTLVKYSASGKEQFIRAVKKGEMFAEAAVFSGGAYPVTAVASARSELLSLKKEKFIRFIREHPDVSLKIMSVMSSLLRHLNNLLTDLSLGTVTSRLAAYLLKKAKLSQSNSVVLDISKQELAFKMGTIPATLSRNLQKLSRDRLIEVKKNRIIIKDISALEDLT